MSTQSAITLALIPIAYLLGSIPFGLVVGLAKGIDPRTQGSKNIGATNLGRLLGGKYFALVFILDLLKGCVPVLIAGLLLRNEPHTTTMYLLWLSVALAAVLGHMFSVFLKFKGGKGVATSAGVVLGLFPYFTYAGVVALIAFVISLKVTRYVSLSSMLAACAFPVAYVAMGMYFRWPVFGEQWPLLVMALLIPAMIVYKHRTNISRLRAGTENRIGAAKV